MLGRLNVGTRSKPNDELRRDDISKCPERFSRSVACKAKPESLRETGVVGKGGKDTEVGESPGDSAELPFAVELVGGRSLDRWESILDWVKALKTGGRDAKFELLSPKEDEFKLVNLASEVGGALPVNIDGFSDEKASNG